MLLHETCGKKSYIFYDIDQDQLIRGMSFYCFSALIYLADKVPKSR